MAHLESQLTEEKRADILTGKTFFVSSLRSAEQEQTFERYLYDAEDLLFVFKMELI